MRKMAHYCVTVFIVLEFANILYGINSIGTILQHPKSRLVPIGVEVTFTCIFRDGLNPHWVINEHALPYRDSIKRIAEEGYIIQRQETADHVSLLSLVFNTTMEKNGTKIYCSSFKTHSDEAVLLVISETPLIQNPLVMNPNKSSILLKWSPPFLWPGSAIDHYHISIARGEMQPGDEILYCVNATFHDAVVSFSKTSDNPTEIRHCSEILFDISAITDNGTELASFTVAGGYLPNAMNITPNGVNITVLFESGGSPLVIITIKLPQTICAYQHVNYSIYIEGSGGVFQHGPYQQYGSNQIRRSIVSGLEEETAYTLIVIVDTQAGISYSQQYSFNTSLQLDDPMDCQMNLSISPSSTVNVVESFVYKVTTGVFVGVTVALLLLTFVISLGALYQRKLKRTTILPNATNRVFNAMIHNPIYDGPLYDSIVQSQFDTLPTNLKTSADEPITLCLNEPSDSDQNTISGNDYNTGSVSPERYIKQSCQAKSDSMCTNFSAPGADTVNMSESTNRSQSVCKTAADCKPNKLFDTSPTYSECTSNDGNLRINETPISIVAKQAISEEFQELQPLAKDDEDNKYTVMQPIGAITFSQDTCDSSSITP